MSRPRCTLNRLPAQLTAAQCARLLRLPIRAVRDAIATGELTMVDTPTGPAIDTRTLLIDLGVPANVIARVGRGWPGNRSEDGTPR